MTEGTLSEWMVETGDSVDAGTVIYRLETDKVESDIEAPAAGTLTILADAGEVYPVGTLLAEIYPGA
jgi:pyruvate/2-oxoglutarate dehydrogenase complex dihydrolipoamide acyltransferase (E2) component